MDQLENASHTIFVEWNDYKLPGGRHEFVHGDEEELVGKLMQALAHCVMILSPVAKQRRLQDNRFLKECERTDF